MRTARYVLVAVIALLMALPVSAQDKQAKKKAPAVKISQVSQVFLNMEKLHKAIDALDLTSEQQEKLGRLRTENEPKMKEMMSKLEAIFTEEQRAAGKEAAEKAKAEKLEGRKLFVAIEAAVKITEEQKVKLEELGKEMSATHREIVKSVMAVLTPEQKEKVKKAMAPAPKKEKVKAAAKKAKD